MRVLLHDTASELYLAELDRRFPSLRFEVCDSYEALPRAVAEFKPLAVLSHKFAGTPYPREALVESRDVRWVHVSGTGTDHLQPWDTGRVTVTNCAGFQAEAMAQFAFAGILSLNAGLPRYARQQAQRHWQPEKARVLGKTLLVIGMGPIGRAVARLGRTLGLRVWGLRAHPAPAEGYEAVIGLDHLHEALSHADYVVLTLPLTPATRGLIDARAVAAFNRDALFVNLARGGIVDEAALAEALQAGRLRGALLDVFAQEPLPPQSPFWGLDNVLVTPHASGLFEGWERAAALLFAENLERFLAGRPLERVVDPRRGY